MIIKPMPRSYRRATAVIVPQTFELSKKGRRSTRQIWMMPQPVGKKARKLAKISKKVKLVWVQSTIPIATITAIVRV